MVAGGFSEAVSPRESVPISESELLLGTVCKITIYDKIAKGTFDAAFGRIAEIEQKMSLNIATSELVKVNNESYLNPIRVSADTFRVIDEALIIAGLSDGAFDPTVGPLVRAWGIGGDAARVPSAEEVSRLLSLVDHTKVRIDRTTSAISLTKPDMILDLGGIAKGFAADEVARILRSKGVKSAIINLGGNILTIGRKPDGSPWRIGIQDPESPRGAYVMIVSVEDEAIVTSGPYERYFEQDGTIYHHILDTVTGYPVRNSIGSVSILAKDSFTADAPVEAIIILNDRSIHLSSGLQSGSISFELTDDRFTIIP